MERRGARIAIAMWLAGVAALAIVAALPGSPLQPPQVGGRTWSVTAPATWRLAGDDPAAVVISAIAVALSILGFALILRAAGRGTLSVKTVVVLTAVGCGVVAILPLLYSRDVYSYVLYGRIWAVRGSNPYLVTPNQVATDPFFGLVGPQWRNTTSVYGPAFTALSGGIARAAPSAGVALAAIR
jgi:hypothetical protein